MIKCFRKDPKTGFFREVESLNANDGELKTEPIIYHGQVYVLRFGIDTFGRIFLTEVIANEKTPIDSMLADKLGRRCFKHRFLSCHTISLLRNMGYI